MIFMAGPALGDDAQDRLVEQYRTILALESQPYGYVSCALEKLDSLEKTTPDRDEMSHEELAAAWSIAIGKACTTTILKSRIAIFAILRNEKETDGYINGVSDAIRNMVLIRAMRVANGK